MWIEITVVVVYLAVLLVIGVLCERFNTDTDDFFRNGCRASWWLTGMSLFMAGISARTYTANAGAAFEAGLGILSIYVTGAIALLFHGIFLARIFRQTRAVTIPEVIRERFNVPTQQIYAYLSCVNFLLLAALWLWGLGIFASTVFGFRVEWVVLGAGAVVVLYSTMGGSWAVMASDFLQGLIMLSVSVLVAILCLSQFDGLYGFWEKATAPEMAGWWTVVKEDGEFAGDQYSWGWHIAMAINMLFAFLSLDAAPRYFAAKDGREASKAGFLAFVLYTLGLVIFFVPPWTARLLYPDEVAAFTSGKSSEAAYAVACMQVLPAGMIGLVIVAIFAATLSSMDVGVNRNAAMVVKDVFPPLAKRLGLEEALRRNELICSRVTSLVLGISSIGLALYFTGRDGLGMFETANEIGALVTLPLLIPMLLGLFVRQAPAWAALFSVGCALVPASMAFVSGYLFQEPWRFQDMLFAVATTGLVAFGLSTMCWRWQRETDRRRIQSFFEKIHRPVDFEKEVGAVGADPARKFVGYAAMAIGVLLLGLTFAQATWVGLLSVVAIAFTLMSIGGVLLWYERRLEMKVKLSRADTTRLSEQLKGEEMSTEKSESTGEKEAGSPIA